MKSPLSMHPNIHHIIDGLDPFDTNVNDIDTSYPVIPAAIYDLKITKAEKAHTKAGNATEGPFQLVLTLETTTDLKSVKGADVPAGLKLTHYIGVSEKPAGTNQEGKATRARTNADIAKDIASLCKSAGVSGSVRGIIDMPAQLEGHTPRVKVTIQKETSEYPEANRIGGFVVVQ